MKRGKESKSMRKKWHERGGVYKIIMALEERLNTLRLWKSWYDNNCNNNTTTRASAVGTNQQNSNPTILSKKGFGKVNSSTNNDDQVNNITPTTLPLPPTTTTTTATTNAFVTNINTNDHNNHNNRLRDQSLLDVWHEELKFEYASILGGGFAPKASDIAIAMMGPEFISTFSNNNSTSNK